MCPGNATAHSEVAVVLVADIEGTCLRVPLAVVIASATSASACEVTVVDVVGIAHEGVSHGAEWFHGGESDAVSAVGTDTHIGIHLKAVASAALGGELEHEIVFAVIDSSQT